MRNGGFKLLLFAGFLLLIWGTFAPVGTIVWWLDRGSTKLDRKTRELTNRVNGEDSNSSLTSGGSHCYIVFLPGVGAEKNEVSPREEAFLDRLEQDQPQCLSVRNVFPYSAANQDLGGQKVFEFLWNVTEEAEGWLELTRYVLEARNVWRMAVSADNRYGPIYNQAIALTIIEQMEKQQPIPTSSKQPIQLILMGTSGGAQVALGTAPYIDKWLPVEITVVSFGGVFDGNEGFDVAKHIYHFRGERDWIENIGGIVFPSRWGWTVGSPYNRARRENRYTVYNSGPHEHQGEENYFGREVAKNDGTTYAELMVKQINQLPIWSSVNTPSK
ncbi:hypothetical protein [Nostoc flagelliforme]|uniref:hypothetical protein n=1 Tax=Nostoc flagelliforme TaxID=1306274 RepID=UPI0018F05AB1|nr:hypothetical protein [Nostoc flagelliforme]